MAATINPDYFVLLDLETTGLDIQNDEILEVALLVVEFSTLTVKDSYSAQIVPSLTWEDKLAESPDALHMHTVNGLIEDVHKKGKPLEKVVSDIHKILLRFSRGKTLDTFVLAGTGVSAFDLPLLKCQVPELASVFHFRCLDTAVIKLWLDIFGNGVRYPGPGSTHRAMDDCRQSLEMFRKLQGLTL